MRIARPSPSANSTSATASALGVQVHDALALLGVEQRRHVVARAAQQLANSAAISSLRRDSVNSSNTSVDVLGVVGEHALERRAQQRDEVVGAAGAR